jgi:hypothetical protein
MADMETTTPAGQPIVSREKVLSKTLLLVQLILSCFFPLDGPIPHPNFCKGWIIPQTVLVRGEYSTDHG